MFSKIFGKKIGDFLSVVINGKPKQVLIEDKEEMQETLQQINEANQGNEEAQKAIIEKLAPPVAIDKIDPDLAKKQAALQQAERDEKEMSTKVEIKARWKETLLNHPYFEIRMIENREAIFAKDIPMIEMPELLADHFVEAIVKGRPIDHLKEFWSLTALCNTPSARQGLYKFIVNQKLIIPEEGLGYVIGFRRLVKVKDVKTEIQSSHTQGGANVDYDIAMKEFAEVVRKKKRAKRLFEVFQNENSKYVLEPVSKHDENRSKVDWKFVGNYVDCLELIKLNKTADEAPADVVTTTVTDTIYTDAHTRSMVIRLNHEPVRMDRSRCDSDPKRECSYGFHLGSPKYVANNGGLGNTIVVCLFSPHHVVSVPYSDAHKMRLCEYYPMFSITETELKNFDLSKYDLKPYIDKYKRFEQKRIQHAIAEVETLEKELLKLTKSQVSSVDAAGVQKLLEQRLALEKEYSARKLKLESLLLDDVNKVLDFEAMSNILRSRLEK